MGTKPKMELRREMRAILSNLDKRWLQAASRELCRNIAKVLESESGYETTQILAWASFFPGEADLATLLDEQSDRRRIYLPTIEEDFKMRFLSVGKDWPAALTEGRFGVPQPGPQADCEYDPDLVAETVVLIPGLAFGRDGSRLGRGKGYYDQFLGRSRMAGVLKIGVCWSLQLLPKVPTDNHDICMDLIVTEDEILRVTPPA